MIKIFFVFYIGPLCVTLLWGLHIVIKQQFFTFIFAVFVLNLLYTYSFNYAVGHFYDKAVNSSG